MHLIKFVYNVFSENAIFDPARQNPKTRFGRNSKRANPLSGVFFSLCRFGGFRKNTLFYTPPFFDQNLGCPKNIKFGGVQKTSNLGGPKMGSKNGSKNGGPKMPKMGSKFDPNFGVSGGGHF
jgi:hypothetical protein